MNNPNIKLYVQLKKRLLSTVVKLSILLSI